MAGWLKAGLIGAVILVVLNVVELVPFAVCCTLPVEWVALGCIGALAAYWMVPPRALGAGAGQGALAGVIAAAIGGLIGIGTGLVNATVLAPLQMSMLRQLPPEVWEAWMEAGIDPSVLTGAGAGAVETVTCGTMCCGAGLVIAAVLGAIGGVIFAAVKSE